MGSQSPLSLTLIGYLLFLFLGKSHIGEGVWLRRDDLVKVDLVHASLVVQTHFSGQAAQVLQDPATEGDRKSGVHTLL